MSYLKWRINNRAFTTFWLDNWLEINEPLCQFGRVDINDNQLKALMKDFCLNSDWNQALSHQMLLANIISKIRPIIVPSDEDGLDELRWFTHGGTFFVFVSLCYFNTNDMIPFPAHLV